MGISCSRLRWSVKFKMNLTTYVLKRGNVNSQSLINVGEFFNALLYFIRQVGPTYKKWGVKESTLCESYFPRTRLWSLNRQYKDKDYNLDYQINDTLYFFILYLPTCPPLREWHRGIPHIIPPPPYRIPPIYDILTVKRGGQSLI